MVSELFVTCRQALLVLLCLSLPLGSYTLYMIQPETKTSSVAATQTDVSAHEQVVNSDVASLLGQMNSSLVATAEEVNDLKTRLGEMDALLKLLQEKSTSVPCVATQKPEKEFFLYTKAKKNWFEAYVDCNIKGMSLASLENEEEYQQVLSQITALDRTDTKNEDFWLSGTDLGHDGTYVWMSTGRSITFNKWYRSGSLKQPDHTFNKDLNEEEHCMELSRVLNNFMNDNCCSLRQSYICEQLN